MNNTITLNGVIHFDPENVTNKHILQSEWKVIAMVLLDAGEICDYYAWFIQKRYGIELNKPLRGPHLTFINDRFEDLKGVTIEDKSNTWAQLKDDWDGIPIQVILDVDVRMDNKHLWLNIPENDRTKLHSIRAEAGLGRPFAGLHMTIGRAKRPQDLEQIGYIHNLIINNRIT